MRELSSQIPTIEQACVGFLEQTCCLKSEGVYRLRLRAFVDYLHIEAFPLKTITVRQNARLRITYYDIYLKEGRYNTQDGIGILEDKILTIRSFWLVSDITWDEHFVRFTGKELRGLPYFCVVPWDQLVKLECSNPVPYKAKNNAT